MIVVLASTLRMASLVYRQPQHQPQSLGRASHSGNSEAHHWGYTSGINLGFWQCTTGGDLATQWYSWTRVKDVKLTAYLGQHAEKVCHCTRMMTKAGRWNFLRMQGHIKILIIRCWCGTNTIISCWVLVKGRQTNGETEQPLSIHWHWGELKWPPSILSLPLYNMSTLRNSSRRTKRWQVQRCCSLESTLSPGRIHSQHRTEGDD